MGPLEKLFMGIDRKRGTPSYDQDIDKLSMLFGDDSPRGAVGNASRALEVERGLPTPPQPRQMAQTALPPIPGEQMAEPQKPLVSTYALSRQVTPSVQSTYQISKGVGASQRNIDRVEFRDEQLSRALGGDYDSTENFGWDGFLTQADMSRSEDKEDVRTKFLSTFPGGEIRIVPTADGDKVVAKKTQEDPFRVLPMTPKIMSAIFSERTAVPIATSLLAPQAVLPQAIAATVGTLIGDTTQKQVERARGFEDPEGGLLGDATGTIPMALASGAIDAGTRGAARVLGIRPTTAGNVELKEAMDAQARLGLPPLVRGQASEWEFIRKMYDQVGSTAGRPGKVVSKQERALLSQFESMSEDALKGLSETQMLDIIQVQMRNLASLADPAALSREGAGEALKRGLKTYEQATSRLASRVYNQTAKDAAGVTMNLAPAQEAAQTALVGVRGPSRVVPGQSVPASEPASGAFKRALEDVYSMKSNIVQYGDKTGYEIVKNLRTRFFDFKNADDPAISRAAGDVYKALSKAMDNPSPYPKFSPGLNMEAASPTLRAAYEAKAARFSASHKKATDLWRWRETNLERAYVASALKSETPEALASKYFQPGNSTALREIKKLIPRPRWAAIQKSFESDLLSAADTKKGLARLQEFRAIDREGLDLLMPDKMRQAQLMEALNAKAQFDASPAAKSIERAMYSGERSLKILKSGTQKEIDDLLAQNSFFRTSGGKDSPQGAALRASVYKDILDKSMTTLNGKDVLDAKLLVSNITDWQHSGKLKGVFNKSDWNKILDYKRYASKIGGETDVGGAIQRGAITGQATKSMFRPTGIIKNVMQPVFANKLVAYALSFPASFRILPNSVYSPLANMPKMYNILSNEIEKSDKLKTRRPK